MPKLGCRCGYIHDLSPIPDDGWRTIKDDGYDDLINNEFLRNKFADSKVNTKEFDQLVKADSAVGGSLGLLYQCPNCHRLMWKKPDTDIFIAFRLED